MRVSQPVVVPAGGKYGRVLARPHVFQATTPAPMQGGRGNAWSNYPSPRTSTYVPGVVPTAVYARPTGGSRPGMIMGDDAEDMANAYGAGPAPEEVAQAQQAATTAAEASKPFDWNSLNQSLTALSTVASAGTKFYATQQAAKSAAAAADAQAQMARAAQQNATLNAQLAASQRPSTMPAWLIPTIIGGVLLLGAGAFFLSKRNG